MRSPLPHDPYITAVADALTTAGLNVVDGHTDDAETHGTHCYLNAVITLDPSGTADLPGDQLIEAPWPHGLILAWEWHTGTEDDGPEHGPQWWFAALNADGSNEHPTDLPVYGYASPAAIVEAARRVIGHEIRPASTHDGGQWRGWTGGIIGDAWDHANELDAACEIWAADEAEDAAIAARYGEEAAR